MSDLIAILQNNLLLFWFKHARLNVEVVFAHQVETQAEPTWAHEGPALHAMFGGDCGLAFRRQAGVWNDYKIDLVDPFEIQRGVDGLNPVTLTSRLRLLMEQEMVERLKEPGKKAVAYALTTKGRDLLPILDEMWKFGQKHFDAKAWSRRDRPPST